MDFFTKKDRIKIATNCRRIVSSDKAGKYVEFSPEHIHPETIYIPDDQKWRVSPGAEFRYKGMKYIEYRTKDNVMVYHQKHTVNYADYKRDMFYVSVDDLDIDNFDIKIEHYNSPQNGV